MHAVGVPVLLCLCSSCQKRTRKCKERQGPRTSSSKGERGRAKARTNKARKLTHRGRLHDGAKNGVAQSTASRKANQIASEKQIALSKQSTSSFFLASSASQVQGMLLTAALLVLQMARPGPRQHLRIAVRTGRSMMKSFESFFFLPCPTSMSPRRRRGAGDGPMAACASRMAAAGSGRDCPF